MHFAIQDILISPPLVHFPRFWTLRGLLFMHVTNIRQPKSRSLFISPGVFHHQLGTVPIFMCFVCRWCVQFFFTFFPFMNFFYPFYVSYDFFYFGIIICTYLSVTFWTCVSIFDLHWSYSIRKSWISETKRWSMISTSPTLFRFQFALTSWLFYVALQ
jgi:hypothetical protein